MISFNLDRDAQKVQRSKFNSSILQFDTHGMRRCVPDNPDFVNAIGENLGCVIRVDNFHSISSVKL